LSEKQYGLTCGRQVNRDGFLLKSEKPGIMTGQRWVSGGEKLNSRTCLCLFAQDHNLHKILLPLLYLSENYQQSNLPSRCDKGQDLNKHSISKMATNQKKTQQRLLVIFRTPSGMERALFL
jgi:hypothetical protein